MCLKRNGSDDDHISDQSKLVDPSELVGFQHEPRWGRKVVVADEWKTAKKAGIFACYVRFRLRDLLGRDLFECEHMATQSDSKRRYVFG